MSILSLSRERERERERADFSRELTYSILDLTFGIWCLEISGKKKELTFGNRCRKISFLLIDGASFLLATERAEPSQFSGVSALV